MSNRWKVKEIRDMVEEINELSLKLGTGRVELQEGTQLYGRAWRLNQLCPSTHALDNHPHFHEYLGWTKHEAGDRLVQIRWRLQELVDEQESKCCRTCGQELIA